MKIGHIENKAAVSPTVTERKATPGAAGQGAEASTKVELSSTALVGSGNTDPVFDADKVKRISDAIRDGKMVVDADVIADKLIANAQELLSAGPKV